MNKKIVVIYHGDCTDGFGGAWAAWLKFGSNAEYIGATDRVNPPKGLAGKEVYFIDWVYPVEAMNKVIAKAKRVVALDHHVTAKEATELAQDFRYSLHHSGAVLAWQYFHPDQPIPKLLSYVQDRDLWSWKLRSTREVLSYVDLQPMEFKYWKKMAAELDEDEVRARIIESGKLLVRYEDRLISKIAAKAVPVRFEGRTVLAVNSAIFHSELGHVLCHKKSPFSIIWREEDGHIRVSLRSNSKNGFNVAKVAEKYGGGGHHSAAGFSLSIDKPLPWKPK